MKKTLKRIISVMLMTGILLSTALIVLPPSTGQAAANVSATASPAEQTGTPGSTVSFAVTVINDEATAVDLKLEVSSTRGTTTPTFADSGTAVFTPVTVGANSSKTVMVDVVLTTAKAGTNDIITLIVTDATDYLTQVSMTVNVIAKGSAISRPLMGINSYSTGDKIPRAGSEFPLTVTYENRGSASAYNVVITYQGDGFFPSGTGGVQTEASIDANGKVKLVQNFLVGDDLSWSEAGTIKATITYSDSKGTSYTDSFTITVSLTSPSFIQPTATPNASLRPQLVITSNSTDIDPLQPGSIFELTLNVKNLGATDAKSVIMVLGGGAAPANEAGTPQPGVSGSGADLTNFAPLGSSNIIVVGDIPQGQSISIKQKLVVNVSIIPGAYTLKTSFSYHDDNSSNYVDDQVITLLVYSLPQVEISFYQDPGMLTAGMPNMLPLQVTNLGKKSFVLGNMKVTSEGADITNNTSLVGALDPGGYFTLDAQAMPMQEGSLELLITINYTDDFNMPREITQTLSVEVMPAMEFTPEPTGEGSEMPVEQAPETFWAKVGRFFKGLFGLDSGVPEPAIQPGSPEIPEDSGPAIVVPKG